MPSRYSARADSPKRDGKAMIIFSSDFARLLAASVIQLVWILLMMALLMYLGLDTAAARDPNIETLPAILL